MLAVPRFAEASGGHCFDVGPESLHGLLGILVARVATTSRVGPHLPSPGVDQHARKGREGKRERGCFVDRRDDANRLLDDSTLACQDWIDVRLGEDLDHEGLAKFVDEEARPVWRTG